MFVQVDAYVEDGNLGLVLLILIVFGISVLPLTYILQFLFSTPATGFVVLIILYIVTGEHSCVCCVSKSVSVPPSPTVSACLLACLLACFFMSPLFSL